MLPIPRHLSEIFQADIEACAERNLEGSIRCTCGCNRFSLKTFSSLCDDGSIGVEEYKNGFALVIKAVCEHCANEWLLFDLSKHGYDGFVCHDGVPIPVEMELEHYKCPQCKDNSFQVSFWIEVEDKEQFIEEVVDEFPDQYTEEDYVDAFNWLTSSLFCNCCNHTINNWLDLELS